MLELMIVTRNRSTTTDCILSITSDVKYLQMAVTWFSWYLATIKGFLCYCSEEKVHNLVITSIKLLSRKMCNRKIFPRHKFFYMSTRRQNTRLNAKG